MANRPTYASMDRNYLMGTADEVRKYVGGEVNNPQYENTCAIRMSASLNYSGLAIPANAPGLYVVKGADKKYYSLRMRELAKWLSVRLGPPDVAVIKPQNGTISRSSFAGMSGIISFDIHFSDATGHIDLWDGKIFHHEAEAGKDYFALAKSVVLWKLP
jgi:hypothetical protein